MLPERKMEAMSAWKSMEEDFFYFGSRANDHYLR